MKIQVADCRVFLNKGHDMPVRLITPAEVLLVRAIHSNNVGSDPVKDLVVIGTVERSSEAEIRRLEQKYVATDKRGTPILRRLFSGYDAAVPETFDGIWPQRAPTVPEAAPEVSVSEEVKVEPLPV